MGVVAFADDKAELFGFCRQFWGNFLASWGLKGASIVVVLIVNYAFVLVIRRLVKFERHHSETARQTRRAGADAAASTAACARMQCACAFCLCAARRALSPGALQCASGGPRPSLTALRAPTRLPITPQSLRNRPRSRSEAIKVFWAQFINSLFVTILVYAKILRLQSIPLLFSGPYTDFVSAWYASVGTSLFLTTLSQAFVPIISSLLLALAHKIGLVAPKAFTQRKLDKAVQGPEFNHSERISTSLNVVFLGLALCGGLPACMPVAALFLGMSYWFDKWYLIKCAPHGRWRTHALPLPYCVDYRCCCSSAFFCPAVCAGRSACAACLCRASSPLPNSTHPLPTPAYPSPQDRLRPARPRQLHHPPPRPHAPPRRLAALRPLRLDVGGAPCLHGEPPQRRLRRSGCRRRRQRRRGSRRGVPGPGLAGGLERPIRPVGAPRQGHFHSAARRVPRHHRRARAGRRCLSRTPLRLLLLRSRLYCPAATLGSSWRWVFRFPTATSSPKPPP